MDLDRGVQAGGWLPRPIPHTRHPFSLFAGGMQGDAPPVAGDHVPFAEEPRNEAYGTVAVFLDLYGNRWDLVQHT